MEETKEERIAILAEGLQKYAEDRGIDIPILLSKREKLQKSREECRKLLDRMDEARYSHAMNEMEKL